jgi:alpha-glucosidase
MILLGSHDRARFHTVVKKDIQKNIAGVTLLMSYPGVPSIFAGDEIGLEGNWGENGRRTIDWDHPEKWNSELLFDYMDLIKIRKESHALAHGGIRWIHVGEDSMAYLRESKKESVLVFVARKGVKERIDLSSYGYSIKKTLFGPQASGKTLAINTKSAVGGMWLLS